MKKEKNILLDLKKFCHFDDQNSNVLDGRDQPIYITGQTKGCWYESKNEIGTVLGEILVDVRVWKSNIPVKNNSGVSYHKSGILYQSGMKYHNNTKVVWIFFKKIKIYSVFWENFINYYYYYLL